MFDCCSVAFLFLYLLKKGFILFCALMHLDIVALKKSGNYKCDAKAIALDKSGRHTQKYVNENIHVTFAFHVWGGHFSPKTSVPGCNVRE